MSWFRKFGEFGESDSGDSRFAVFGFFPAENNRDVTTTKSPVFHYQIGLGRRTSDFFFDDDESTATSVSAAVTKSGRNTFRPGAKFCTKSAKVISFLKRRISHAALEKPNCRSDRMWELLEWKKGAGGK